MTALVKTEQQIDYILLDGSGSMAGKWPEVCGSIDAYVGGLKAENINSRVYFHLFSSSPNLDILAYDGPVSDYTSMVGLEAPFLATPLYDAVSIMGRRMNELDPPKARIVIATDGQETGSHFTDLHQAKAILDWMRAKGWTVTFIGADFSNAQQAAMLGADKQTAIGVQKKLLAEAARNLAKKAARHALYGEDIGFSEDEQQQFGGYLAAPTTGA